MDSLLSLRRSALIYGLCLPLAILLGYVLARPGNFTSLAVIALTLGIMSLPLWMRWHHQLLILSWNASLIVPFLPGQPSLWMCLSFISLSFALLLRIMTKKGEFLSAPAVTFWICFILVVTLVTAKFTGGIGARAIGSAAYGGKRYLYVFCAVVGYFAIISTRIRPNQAAFLVVGFFLSAITSAVSNLAYALGPKFYFLYYLFPSALAHTQAVGENFSLERYAGIAFAAESAVVALVARYGLRGVFDLTRPWRLFLFCALVAASLFGGFRSLLIVLLLLFAFQFYFEGQSTLRNTAIVTGSLVLLLAASIAFSTKFPAAVQRALCFLPIPVEETVRVDAVGTAEWRWVMWKVLLPNIPKYLWLGKGFTYDGADYYLTQEAMRRGYFAAYESTLIDGNYHNGILTVIIPFGVWGMIGLFGFVVAALRVLYLNYRNGDPSLKTLNTLLISWFLARLCMYLTIYGAFDLDLPFFVAAVGLSLSLNGGIRPKHPALMEEAAQAVPKEVSSSANDDASHT